MTGAVPWRPSASHDALRLRAAVNRLIREFMAQRGVLEVETPVLSRAGTTDPHIASFPVEFSGRTDDAPRTRWLRTSPEFALKRLVASGIGDCYELGRVFRDGEAGGRHNPEFTMLEWYRLGIDHVALSLEVVDLLQDCLALVGRSAGIRATTYSLLFRESFGIDAHGDDIDTLRNALGNVVIDPAGLTRDDWLDLLMTHRIQPGFAQDSIHVVHDYPASQCALARVREGGAVGDTAVAERFEVFLGPLELANGYHELLDPAEQSRRFARDAQRRKDSGAAAVPPDRALLDALTAGMPSCAGVALGVDRLLMAMTGAPSIADVLAFDFARA